ncbi:hypothetical protein ON010_g18059 [Phytophthora cinnamomi]|nr:hypothetical protein ON010_g18059 [Phytophthora cinnamomi]
MHNTRIDDSLTYIDISFVLREQRLNLNGIQEAKRGTRFQRIRVATDSTPHSEVEEVTLMLSKDGSTLQVVSDVDNLLQSSVQLVDIQGITLHATPTHSWSLQVHGHDARGDNNATSVPTEGATETFVASSAVILNRWIIALTCGANAFQRQRELQSTAITFPDAKAADLVWQAARLRIFELAEILPLTEAVDHVNKSIPTLDRHQCDALRCRLQFLQCNEDFS